MNSEANKDSVFSTKGGSVKLAATATMTISANGVFHIKASDIVKSSAGVAQLAALKSIKKKGAADPKTTST